MLVRIRDHKAFFLWLLLSVVGIVWLGLILGSGTDKSVFLPGVTTSGHHQIELQCNVCHTQEKAENIFTASGVPNSACNSCHEEDLLAASDSHPARKFKNPENAIFVQHINALDCITCHREHNEKITHDMAVTIPADYCAHCHEVTLENLKSHADLAFSSCATAGCHNYHDNMALSPSFMLKHFGEPKVLETPKNRKRQALERWLNEGNEKRNPLVAADASSKGENSIVTSWSHSAHAAAGVNCSDCHGGEQSSKEWIEMPDHQSCSSCHETEVADFLKGKHGMRLAHEGLSPMTPAMARIEMKPAAAHKSLSCSSCHDPHRADPKVAAFNSCASCHDDPHTRNYQNSAHYDLWMAELDGSGLPGSGVSCATCHMPREKRPGNTIVVNHNQSANLKPNDKMLSTVCMNCHGMQFAMDSLADPLLIESNFSGPPSKRHPGLRWIGESAIKRGDDRVIKLLKETKANRGGKPKEEIIYPPNKDNQQ